MAQIQYNDSEVRALFRRWRRQIRNPRPLMHDIGGVVANRARLSFRQQKSPDGKKWAALSAATRRQRGASAKILRDTGVLANSFRYRIASGGRSVVVGSSANRARYHQFGTQHLPARPFLPTSNRLPSATVRRVVETNIRRFFAAR